MNAKRKCSQHVFSGERGDIGGHPCPISATIERDGKMWCHVHDPVAVQKRRKRQEEGWREEREAQARKYRREEAAYESLSILREIIISLPARRDWLDPVLEKRAKAALAKAGTN